MQKERRREAFSQLGPEKLFIYLVLSLVQYSLYHCCTVLSFIASSYYEQGSHKYIWGLKCSNNTADKQDLNKHEVNQALCPFTGPLGNNDQ